MSNSAQENPTSPSAHPEGEHPSLALVGRQIIRGEQMFTITDVMLGAEYKPFTPKGTFNGAVVFQDKTGQRFFGQVRHFATPEEIEAALNQNGYALVPQKPEQA